MLKPQFGRFVFGRKTYVVVNLDLSEVPCSSQADLRLCNHTAAEVQPQEQAAIGESKQANLAVPDCVHKQLLR